MNEPDNSERPADAGFLSRWSRRKAQVRQSGEAKAEAPVAPAQPSASPAVPAAGAPAESAVAARALAGTGTGAAVSADHSAAAEVPRPTLQDVEQLDASSDYRSFVARDVDPQVRNAAFKKLFHSDPHFNVMDGLDVYIDDYNTPNPLPVAVMKTLVQARALGLIDDELKEQDLPPPDPVSPGPEAGTDTSTAAASTHPNADDDRDPAAPPQDAGFDPETVDAERASEAPGAAAVATARAEVVHLLHVEPVDAVTAGLSGPAMAESQPAGPGIVVPFPRRPGSADPT